MENIDWEFEHQKDVIYQLERYKDIEASWQQWEHEQKRKSAKIILNENYIRKSSFHRTTKKILQLRSHISIKTS